MSTIRLLTLGLAPLVVLALILAAFIFASPGLLGPLGASNIPVESVEIERILLEEGRIVAYAINSGPREVTIAQILVNDAIWDGHVNPSTKVPRLGRVTITIPYHWVEGEPVKISIVTSNGFVFSRSLDVAVLTPVPTVDRVWSFGLIGVYVGVIPVFLGLAWLPLLSKLKARWHNFLLSLTAGLLLFLAVDALGEAFQVSARLPGPFQGAVLLTVGLVGSFLGLEVFGERALASQRRTLKKALLLSYLIAFGIGLHNLGEGLLIGAAYALGEVGLGTFLILGFTIHNTTEGLAIATPIVERMPTRNQLISLGLLAGVPTIFGAWIGGFTYSDLWALLFLAVGTGAILQVVYEILSFMTRGKNVVEVLSERRNFVGLMLGFVIMYLTALLVA